MTQPQEVLLSRAQGGLGTAQFYTLERQETSINICKKYIGSIWKGRTNVKQRQEDSKWRVAFQVTGG